MKKAIPHPLVEELFDIADNPEPAVMAEKTLISQRTIYNWRDYGVIPEIWSLELALRAFGFKLQIVYDPENTVVEAYSKKMFFYLKKKGLLDDHLKRIGTDQQTLIRAGYLASPEEELAARRRRRARIQVRVLRRERKTKA